MVEVVELGKGGWYLEHKTFKGKKIGQWVLRLNLPKGYAPSFKDLAEWLCVIGMIEDKKYPFGEGRHMSRKFVNDAINAAWPTPRILKEHGLKF